MASNHELPEGRQRAVDALFDFLVVNPDGVTKTDMEWGLELARPNINQAIHDLRYVLGSNSAPDTINLAADPVWRGEWTYHLVGTMDGASPWATNRLKDSETRLLTIEHVMRSVSVSPTAPTTDRRRARIWVRAFARAREDLEELNGANA